MENEKYSELLSHIAEIHMILDKHSDQIDLINKNLNGVNKNLDDVNNNLDGVNNNLDDVNNNLDGVNGKINAMISNSNETNITLREILKTNIEHHEKTNSILEKLYEKTAGNESKLSKVDGLEKHFEELDERVKRLENLYKAS